VSVFGIAAALSLGAGSAHAVQLAISQPDPQTFLESDGLVKINFRLVNTGLPEFKEIRLLEILQETTSNGGDDEREVLRNDFVGCFVGDTVVRSIMAGQSCTVSSFYRILDGDPFDEEDQKVDESNWTAGIIVKWDFLDGDTHFDAKFTTVTIKDDPVPEPSAWTMMLAGFAALGAALRYSRGRRHRAHADTLSA
jgi:hypothetical protein